MKITANKVVSITYKLSIDNKLIESVDEKQPLLFLVGNSGLPEKFEEKMEGLAPNDAFDFVLSPAEAFGNHQEEDVLNLPIEDFLSEDGSLDIEFFQVGKLIPLTDDQGHHHRAKILEISKLNGYMKLDFNHPLAGKTLHFTGKVFEVRDASKEELEHGHAHGPGGHHHH